jgi:hypothetical protein
MQVSGNSGIRSGRFSLSIKAAILVASGVYAAGDCIGGKITLDKSVRISGQGAVFENLTITDPANKLVPLSVLIFDEDPTGAVISDQSPFSFGSDLNKCAAVFTVDRSNYIIVGSTSVATIPGITIYVKNNEESLFFYVAVVVTAAITFASPSVLNLTFSFAQD